jgi:hypothetical protein
MQAAQIDRAPLGQKGINQEMPALLIIGEGIAIVGKRQSQNAFSHHVGDAAEGNSSPGRSATIEDNVRMRVPAIRIRQHLDPSGGMKDTT